MTRKPRIGTHVAATGYRQGLGEMHRAIVAHGGQLVITSAGDNGACNEALSIDPNALAILRLRANAGDSMSLDTPFQQSGVYWESAESYRQRTLDELALVTDFDRRTFVGQFNEVDKEQVPFLAAMAVELIPQYIADGIRTAWWGWSAGEPEYDHWLEPEMVDFLRLAEQHPDYVMICLHEYSYTLDLMDGYPYKVGRWQFLRDACEEIGVDFSKLNIVIKEFGWTYETTPPSHKTPCKH